MKHVRNHLSPAFEDNRVISDSPPDQQPHLSVIDSFQNILNINYIYTCSREQNVRSIQIIPHLSIV